ncbi:hypothetical protein [Ciceribacter selenitireducens]|uniref:Knr4/Smi1-like domain-containing protein n=1 Tax=Ciceribacter selenitireducens ATCC BAA-1503 TaxID=1336235 RepID=A0A376AGA8_9HYPH|nr:hypothetical protein [Ciceribacter selenitireducens]SSC66754.1 unnamed protein product [Ciceribacter selenitireducens ATCC BAA-1503]
MAGHLPSSAYRAREDGGVFSSLVPVSAAELDVLRASTPDLPETFYTFAREIGLGQTLDGVALYLPEPATAVSNHTSALLYNGEAMHNLQAMFGGPPPTPPALDLSRVYEFCHTGASWSYCFVPNQGPAVYALDYAGPTLNADYESFADFIESLIRP